MSSILFLIVSLVVVCASVSADVKNSMTFNSSEPAHGMRAGITVDNDEQIKGVEVSSGTCSYSNSCTVSGYEGACVSISSGCCSSGVVTSNLCPGSSDIKCCTQSKCTTPSGSGTCMQTSLCSSKGGKSVAGYCSGPSDLQCCVTGSSSGQYGLDISSTMSTSAASCFTSSGYSFAVPRGYQSVGQVDTQVCTSIINAYNAGFKVRDAYLFPCS